jgi:hypothetical protein
MRTWLLACAFVLSFVYLGICSPFAQLGYYEIAKNNVIPAQFMKVNAASIDLIGIDHRLLKTIKISEKKGNHWVGSENSVASGLHVYSFSFEPSSVRWYPYGAYFKVIDPFKLIALISKNK